MHKGRKYPMIWAMLPLLLGVCLASLVSLPHLATSIFLLSMGVGLLFTRNTHLLYPLLFGCGYIAATISASTPNNIPTEQRAHIVALKTGRGNEAEILAYQDINGQWQQCAIKAVYHGTDDISYQNVVAQCDMYKVDPQASNYHKYLHRSSIAAIVKITKLFSSEAVARPLSARINDWAYERLQRLPLLPDSFASAAAMTLDRSELLNDRTVEAYARSGTSHMLALSGMHLGIVLMIVIATTIFWSLLPSGHIAADIFSIAAVWLFVLMTGLSESVLRAAWMYSILRFTMAISRDHNSPNALLLTAAIMLVVDPKALYSPSFQLSFAAVASIIMVGAPAMKHLCRNNFWHDYIVGSVVIGTVATIATAPIILYYFGSVSLLGPIMTMFLVPLMTVIILGSILWILMPIPLLTPLFHYPIEVAATLQNSIVMCSASLQWGYISLPLSPVALVVSYLAMAAIFIYLKRIIKPTN